MNDFAIITDSAMDMTGELVDALNLEVLPLRYTMQGKNYESWPDHRDMSLKRFYQLMREGEVATTAAINVHEFEECIRGALEQGKDALVLPFDAAISSTHQYAVLAVENLRPQFPDRKIRIVDTRCVTVGLYLLLRGASARRSEGKSVEETWQWCEDNKGTICTCFTVEDLKYLRRGGRISAATAVVGGMLNIKPMLHVDPEGALINIGKVRGRGAALKSLVDLAEKYITDKSLVALCHGDCPEDAEKVARDLRERVGVQEVLLGDVGPIIGAHTGPGTVLLGFIGTERTEVTK